MPFSRATALSYAELKPLEYRLMFGTPWPESAQHPDLVKHAVHAFDILRDSLRRMHGDAPGRRAQADLDALFTWSTLHGMASIKQANVMQHLELEPDVRGRFKADLMAKIGIALAGGEANPSASEEGKR